MRCLKPELCKPLTIPLRHDEIMKNEDLLKYIRDAAIEFNTFDTKYIDKRELEKRHKNKD